MTIPAPVTSPYAQSPVASAGPVGSAAPLDRWRWLLSGVIGILGGYLTVSSLNGQLLIALSGRGQYDLELNVFFVLQALFALAVTTFAFLVAPGPMPRRVAAVVLFLVIIVVFTIFLIARFYGGLRIGGPVINVVANTYWVVLLVGGLAWLIAAGARPVAYLSLLLTFIVMPLGLIFALNNISSGISSTVQLLLSLIVAIVILLVSRPAATASAAPVSAAPMSYDAPAATTAAQAEEAAELAPAAYVTTAEPVPPVAVPPVAQAAPPTEPKA